MTYPSIRIEGQILSADLIDAIEQGNKHSQDARDFGFETRVSVKNEIADAWAAARSFWAIYQNKLAKLDETSVATTETRNLWLSPLLSQLGYQPELASAAEVNGKSYAISHRDHSRDSLPIHVMGWGDEMDKRRVGVNRLSPHATLQEYLNVTEHLYGLVSNGSQLRLLRDSSRLIKLTYLEFDLQRMFEEELYADFAILFRLLHASRLPQDQANVSSSIIERYHLDALESGSRIREGLRDAVEQAMHGIANGLLSQEKNRSLQELVEKDKLTAQELHHALLRLIYRLLFLMVIEERNLVHPSSVPLRKRRIYFDHYSIQRLRRLADHPHLCDRRKTDLWHGLSRTLSLFEESGKGQPLGIEPLGSELFRTEGIRLLLDHTLDNGTLLKALRALSLFQDGDQSRRVNYSALDVEELGSIYESLLELQPTFQGHAFHYKKLAGSERKTTGSYYTPAPLVQELIKSALIPVLEANLKAAETQSEKEQALLATRICDPACGSGAFLIAAAHHLAFRLAQIRAGEDAHAPGVQRKALRDVVSHCIFGVDINPLSVELCKVSLWLLAVEPGKPLSFLDHHIRCGNSLLGTNPALLAKGIPQAAYKKLLGDTKESCDYMKSLNKDALDGQKQLFDDDSEPWKKLGNMPAVAAQLETAEDDTIEARQKKEATYQKLIAGAGYENSRLLADAWCAAFVWPKNSLDYGDTLTTEHLLKIEQNPHHLSPKLRSRIRAISEQYAFFHWHLEFPAVFRIPGKDEDAEFSESGLSGGFDVMLGNPPWDRMKNDPTEWFAALRPEIASEANTDERNQLIADLESVNFDLFQKWQTAVREFECTSSLFRNSKLIPLGTKGEADLSTIFADLASRLIAKNGRLGMITSSTTVTGKSSVPLLNSWTSNERLNSVWEFINTKRYFKIDSRQRYALITLTSSGRSPRTAIAFDLIEPTQIPSLRSALSYSDQELELLSPNTKQFPKIGSETVQTLLIRLARFAPPLKTKKANPYGFKTAFIFEESKSQAFLSKIRSKDHPVPVLEGKSFVQFNHRFATYEGCSEQEFQNKNPRETTVVERTDPTFTSSISTRLYASKEETKKRYTRSFDRPFSFAAREVTNSTNERTVIAALIPQLAILHTAWVFDLKELTHKQSLCALAVLNSFVYDFAARQKISTSHLSKYTWEQLPFYPPTQLCEEIGGFLIPRI
ncbi:SAM-dependent methyltransferase, partial [Akkermansiaceae bacterium]|nr:SAM-dependent methyltransferase [Akkermansiaceae bacterium]